MDKQQKQIEEMAKDLKENLRLCAGVKLLDHQVETIVYELSKKYQPKLPENAVVLSREEFDELKQAKILLSFREETIKYLEDANIRYAEALENKGKETAEKFVNETTKRKQTLMNPYTDDESECVSIYWIYKLAKQLGVEIKEA